VLNKLNDGLTLPLSFHQFNNLTFRNQNELENNRKTGSGGQPARRPLWGWGRSFPARVDLNPNSGHFLSPEKGKEIAGWLAGIGIVGEISGPTVPATWADYPLAALQVDNRAALAALQDAGLPIWYALTVATPHDLAVAGTIMGQIEAQVAGFVLRGDLAPTSAILADLRTLASRFPLLLGMGFTAPTVLEVLATVNPLGLALEGDLAGDEIAELLEQLEMEDEADYSPVPA
jgi:phosphoribosylanthranilate isomerase